MTDTQEFQDVDVNSIRKGMSRRDFLKRTGASAAAGAVAGFGTQKGAKYVANAASELIAYFERNIRTLAVDLEEATGILEKRVAQAQSGLKQAYKHPDLKISQELRFATQEDINDLNSIIENCDKQITHYDFVENFKIAHDRFRNQVLDIGNKLYSVQDWEGRRKVDKGIGLWIQKKAAKITGTKLPENQQSKMDLAIAAKKKLEELCKTYNANSDLRRAIPVTIRKLNQYLTDATLSQDERQFYSLMKKEFEAGNHTGTLDEFMRDYEGFGDRAETFLENKKEDYEQVKKSKAHVLSLQEKLRKGINLKQTLREQTETSFAANYEQFKTSIDAHVTEVDNSIKELKALSYNLKTRADKTNQDTLRQSFDKAMISFVKYAPCAIGTTVAAATYGLLSRGRKLRTERNVTSEVIEIANQRGKAYNDLKEQTLNTIQTTFENGEAI